MHVAYGELGKLVGTYAHTGMCADVSNESSSPPSTHDRKDSTATSDASVATVSSAILHGHLALHTSASCYTILRVHKVHSPPADSDLICPCPNLSLCIAATHAPSCHTWQSPLSEGH
jgi:hypothetical protein